MPAKLSLSRRFDSLAAPTRSPLWFRRRLKGAVFRPPAKRPRKDAALAAGVRLL